MNLSPDHELIRDSVRRLAEAELAPIAARIDADDWFPRDFFLRLGEIGALGVLVPEEYGGSGGDYIGAALIMEELARVSGSVSLSFGARIEGVPAYDAIGGSLGFRRPGYTISIEPGISWTGTKNSFSINTPVALYRIRERSAPEIALGAPGGDAAFADFSILASFTHRF